MMGKESVYCPVCVFPIKKNHTANSHCLHLKKKKQTKINGSKSNYVIFKNILYVFNTLKNEYTAVYMH